MKLTLKNFANVENAEINLNGVTVLTGKTDTGKEYITKTLYGIIHGLHDIDDQVAEVFEKKGKYIKKIQELMDETTDEMLLAKLCGLYRMEKRNLKYINELGQEIIHENFCKLFYDQINSLDSESENTEIIFKDDCCGTTYMEFVDERCVKFDSKTDFNHDAFLLNNPNVLNLTNVDLNMEANINLSEKHMIKSLQHDDESQIKKIVINQMKETVLKEIDSIFHEVIHADYVISPALYKTTCRGIVPVTGRINISLEKEDYPEPIKCPNIAPGIQLFIILQRLLEEGKLKSKSTLIIENPDAYLDPELQVKFAELLILLREKMGIYIVLTTHSHYLIDALDLFSVKYGISDQADFYFMEKKDEKVTVENVNDNMERIYRESADVVQYLENLRYEVNHD